MEYCRSTRGFKKSIHKALGYSCFNQVVLQVPLGPNKKNSPHLAFQELTNLEKNSKSSREAAEILEAPNSSMQYWIERLEQDTTLSNAMIFLSTTPEGLKFLNRLVISVMKLMKCGPSGIRGMQEF